MSTGRGAVFGVVDQTPSSAACGPWDGDGRSRHGHAREVENCTMPQKAIEARLSGVGAVFRWPDANVALCALSGVVMGEVDIAGLDGGIEKSSAPSD